MSVRRIAQSGLSALSRQAQAAERLRCNLNLHGGPDDPVQRLLNALEPGTYVRPHRHMQSDRWELMTILCGRAALLTLDDEGRVQERIELDAQTLLVEVPAGRGTR